MKALTLHQPYATLIARGQKWYETRSWQPPVSLYGQRIAIHAGTSRKSLQWLQRQPFYAELEASLDLTDLPVGGIVATAVLDHVLRVEQTRISYKDPQRVGRSSFKAVLTGMTVDATEWAYHIHLGSTSRTVQVNRQEYLLGDWSAGRYCWRFVDVQLVAPPVPCRGHQRIWNVPETINL